MLTALMFVSTVYATTASAAVIQFEQSDAVANQGSLQYGGGDGPLFGQTIGLDQILLTGQDAPGDNDNSLACFGCALNFNTGLNTQKGPSEWRFNTLASNFQITGNAYTHNPDGTLADAPIASGTLLSGGFDSAQRVVLDETGSTASLRFTGSGTDQKATALLDYFGLGTNLESTFDTVLSGSNVELTGAGFSADVIAATATNTVGTPARAVPEPSSWAMFGLGALLLGAGFTRRAARGDSFLKG